MDFDHALTSDYAINAGAASHSTYANSSLRATYLGNSFTVFADDLGRLSVGTTSPQANLHIKTTTDTEIFRAEDETGTEAMVIDKDGNIIIFL